MDAGPLAMSMAAVTLAVETSRFSAQFEGSSGVFDKDVLGARVIMTKGTLAVGMYALAVVEAVVQSSSLRLEMRVIGEAGGF